MSGVASMAKKAIRPLIPDALMARYRRHQHSRAVRTNVDIYVRDDRAARRWRAFTPDTYRVVSAIPLTTPRRDAIVIGEPNPELERYLGFHGCEVVALGRVNKPSMRSMRITEPVVRPRSIVTTRSILEEAGIEDMADPPAVLRVLGDAGARIGLVPEVVRETVAADLPPIDGDAVVVMAAVPLHDIGGGSRAAQIAFELVRRGYHVTYVYQFPSSEGVDLGLRYPHRRLEEHHLDAFVVESLTARTGSGVVIVEAPIGEFIPSVEHLKDSGWTVLYDVIDDWTDEALGGMWYAPVFEQRIVDLADGFSASAPDLRARIAGFGHEAVLAPNAVNVTLFGKPLDGARPHDLPDGPLIGYHGSLYGDWFDWGALRAVAEAFTDHTVVVIGDDRGVPSDLPRNIVFLGLKAQGDLAAYLRHFDVGLVPFTITDVTHAVSPLKVYEYLACGVPVAAPPLRALEGVVGVSTDSDLTVAVREALQRPRPDANGALAAHSWGARLAVMMGAIGRDLAEPVEDGIRVLRKPPMRYTRSERWIRDVPGAAISPTNGP
ncbi:MAG TPA: glycosyltransferase [Acidimicrobiia bacterium]|nr:glycosyltransferase [Acidimicrobiia bacterium]